MAVFSAAFPSSAASSSSSRLLFIAAATQPPDPALALWSPTNSSCCSKLEQFHWPPSTTAATSYLTFFLSFLLSALSISLWMIFSVNELYGLRTAGLLSRHFVLHGDFFVHFIEHELHEDRDHRLVSEITGADVLQVGDVFFPASVSFFQLAHGFCEHWSRHPMSGEVHEHQKSVKRLWAVGVRCLQNEMNKKKCRLGNFGDHPKKGSQRSVSILESKKLRDIQAGPRFRTVKKRQAANNDVNNIASDTRGERWATLSRNHMWDGVNICVDRGTVV